MGVGIQFRIHIHSLQHPEQVTHVRPVRITCLHFHFCYDITDAAVSNNHQKRQTGQLSPNLEAEASNTGRKERTYELNLHRTIIRHLQVNANLQVTVTKINTHISSRPVSGPPFFLSRDQNVLILGAGTLIASSCHPKTQRQLVLVSTGVF